jgi:hypothetical protein
MRRPDKELRANPQSIRFRLAMVAHDDPRTERFGDKEFWNTSVVEEIRRSSFIDRR